MDLLKDKPELNLYDSNWKVCSVETSNGPQFIGEKAVVRNSMLHDGCTLFGEAHHSVIFRDVFIGNNTYIKDSIIMPNVKIEDNVMIHKAIIGENTVIKSGSIIGSRDKDSVQYNVEKNNKDIVVIGEGAIIDSGLKIGVNSIISAEDCEEIREISKEKEIAI
jgi:glucose-1-phosphate adenylyltransferase